MRRRALTVLLLAAAAAACRSGRPAAVITDTICAPTRAFVRVELRAASQRSAALDATGELLVRFPAEVVPFHPRGGAEAALLRDAEDRDPVRRAYSDSTGAARLERVPPGRHLLRLRAIGFDRHVTTVDARAGYVDTVVVHGHADPAACVSVSPMARYPDLVRRRVP